MKNLAIFVATGFEDVELVSTLDVLNRAEVSYDLYSVENKKTVKGKYEAMVATKPIKEFSGVADYQGVFMPGGPGYKGLLASAELTKILKDFKAKRKFLTAICAAPEVLLKAGVIDGKTITSHPEHAQVPTNTGKEVEVDGKVITGRDYRATIQFADTLAGAFK